MVRELWSRLRCGVTGLAQTRLTPLPPREREKERERERKRKRGREGGSKKNSAREREDGSDSESAGPFYMRRVKIANLFLRIFGCVHGLASSESVCASTTGFTMTKPCMPSVRSSCGLQDMRRCKPSCWSVCRTAASQLKGCILFDTHTARTHNLSEPRMSMVVYP